MNHVGTGVLRFKAGFTDRWRMALLSVRSAVLEDLDFRCSNGRVNPDMLVEFKGSVGMGLADEPTVSTQY